MHSILLLHTQRASLTGRRGPRHWPHWLPAYSEATLLRPNAQHLRSQSKTILNTKLLLMGRGTIAGRHSGSKNAILAQKQMPFGHIAHQSFFFFPHCVFSTSNNVFREIWRARNLSWISCHQGGSSYWLKANTRNTSWRSHQLLDCRSIMKLTVVTGMVYK